MGMGGGFAQPVQNSAMYGGGKGGGIPPVFAMPYGSGFGGGFGGGLGGYRGPTYAQPMVQPQPSYNLNQGPFGGGQFRRNFGSYNHMAMSGTGPGSQMYGIQNRLPNIYQGPMNQGRFPQIANASQGPMVTTQPFMEQPFMDTSQQVQRMSAEDAYKQAQDRAREQRQSGFMGRIQLPGEMKFEDFEKNYNRPQQLLGVAGASRPMNQGQVQLLGSQQDLRPESLQGSIFQGQQQTTFNRGNALGGLGQLARRGFFR